MTIKRAQSTRVDFVGGSYSVFVLNAHGSLQKALMGAETDRYTAVINPTTNRVGEKKLKTGYYSKNTTERGSLLMSTPREIINHLLPFMIPAGRYSVQIQGNIGTHPAKEGSTIFHHALSDADLTIQSFLEVVLLARFPEVSFFSEEGEHSLNAKYFPHDSELEILLDPIDGTRSYIDNRDHFQIIVTIHNRNEIVGVLCYMPRRDQCYVAVKGEGAFVLSTQEMALGAPGTKVSVVPNNGPILLFNSPELEAILSPHFVVRDLAVCYRNGSSEHDSTDLLDSKASAVVLSNCQAIDGGALAFVASEAGATVSHFSGELMGSFRTSPKRVLSNVIVAADPELSRKLREMLTASA